MFSEKAKKTIGIKYNFTDHRDKITKAK